MEFSLLSLRLVIVRYHEPDTQLPFSTELIYSVAVCIKLLLSWQGLEFNTPIKCFVTVMKTKN